MTNGALSRAKVFNEAMASFPVAQPGEHVFSGSIVRAAGFLAVGVEADERGNGGNAVLLAHAPRRRDFAR